MTLFCIGVVFGFPIPFMPFRKSFFNYHRFQFFVFMAGWDLALLFCFFYLQLLHKNATEILMTEA